MNKEKERKIKWGGARENAGRKSIWNHQETCTIRIPKVFAPKLHEIAHKLDKGCYFEFDINSSFREVELISNSSQPELEKQTKSSQERIDFVTKTNRDLSQAIDLAKQILKYKKSARISLAKFLSKLYNVPVTTEDLK